MDWIDGSKSSETCELYMRRFECQFVDRVSGGLPGQRKSPSLDSVFGIIIPWGPKFDVLR